MRIESQLLEKTVYEKPYMEPHTLYIWFPSLTSITREREGGLDGRLRAGICAFPPEHSNGEAIEGSGAGKTIYVGGCLLYTVFYIRFFFRVILN